MTALRTLGGVLVVAVARGATIRYRQRSISRLNLIISWLIATAVVMLAIAPSLFDPIFDVFNFRPGSGQRLTAVLLFAVVVLFVLVIRLESYTDVNERGIRQLVESLGVERFDWDAAGGLPEGKRIVVVSPAYNEAENVGEVIRALPVEVEGYHVVSIVVDDCSEDATAEIAREGGPRPPHLGFALLLLGRDDPHRPAGDRHLERIPSDAGRDAPQADPRAGSVLDERGHHRGPTAAREDQGGARHVPDPPRRRVQEAQVASLRLELRQGSHQDVAAVAARTRPISTR